MEVCRTRSKIKDRTHLGVGVYTNLRQTKGGDGDVNGDPVLLKTFLRTKKKKKNLVEDKGSQL